MKKLVLLLVGWALLAPLAQAKDLRCVGRASSDRQTLYPFSEVSGGPAIGVDKIEVGHAAYSAVAQVSCASVDKKTVDKLIVEISKDGVVMSTLTAAKILDANKKETSRFAAVISEDGQFIIECWLY